jgi:hypothetical protein
VGSFKDASAVRIFARGCGVLTVEIEHVDVDTLDALAAEGVDVEPRPSTIRIIQVRNVGRSPKIWGPEGALLLDMPVSGELGPLLVAAHHVHDAAPHCSKVRVTVQRLVGLKVAGNRVEREVKCCALSAVLRGVV